MPQTAGGIVNRQPDQRRARLRAWHLELLHPTPRLAPQLASDRPSPNSPASRAMERRITQIRWVGAGLCALVAPFLGLGTRLPALYLCLAVIAGYNVACPRSTSAWR